MKLGCIGCLTLLLLTATFGATLWGAVQTLSCRQRERTCGKALPRV